MVEISLSHIDGTNRGLEGAGGALAPLLFCSGQFFKIKKESNG